MSAMSAEYHRKYYQIRRQRIIHYLGGHCVRCGSRENLEIDHKNRQEKSFSISTRLSLCKIVEELEKCQLLCQLCHREKTRSERDKFSHGTLYGWMKKKCPCDECQTAKHKWHNRRNLARRKQVPVSELVYELPSK